MTAWAIPEVELDEIVVITLHSTSTSQAKCSHIWHVFGILASPASHVVKLDQIQSSVLNPLEIRGFHGMTVYRWLQSYYIMFWYNIYIYYYILLYIIIYYYILLYIYIIYVLIIAHMAFFWTLSGTLKDILTRQPGVFAESYVSCPFCKANNTSSSFVWLCRFASRAIQNGPGCWCTQPTWMVGAWDWSWSRIDCYGWSHSLLEFFGSQWQPFRWEIPS